MSLDKEFDIFVNKLNEVRIKFEQQKFPAFQESYNQNVIKFQDHVTKNTEQMQTIYSEIKELKDKCIDSETMNKAGAEQITTTEDQLKSTKCSLDDVLREKERLETDLIRLTASSDKDYELLDTQIQANQSHLQELEKSARFFTDRLGLKFKKISGNRLQIVYTCLDPEDPSRPFYFIMHLDANQMYVIDSCEPAVVSLAEMTTKLNDTNNFSAFVINLRREFKSLLTSR